MTKNFFLFFFIGFICGLYCFSIKQRIEFEKWPQMKFKNVRILIADSILSNQGFAGADSKDMKNTIIMFPNIEKGVIFTNIDQGFGSVKEDIKIYYLDKNFKIIKSDIIKREKGISIPPEETYIAFEGLP